MPGINRIFVNKIEESFHLYLKTSARSNEKLKPIHSFIANTLKNLLNDNGLRYFSLCPDCTGGEKKVAGRYMYKNVDIAVCRGEQVLGAIGFKFVMSNYKQNSNNYFENMLGETANLRSNNIPYFQVLVLLKELPYYEKNTRISRIEHVNMNNLDKYVKLSQDDIKSFLHTPTKTLIYIVETSEKLADLTGVVYNKKTYAEHFNNTHLTVNKEFEYGFGQSVIINDFEKFIIKVAHYIQSI